MLQDILPVIKKNKIHKSSYHIFCGRKCKYSKITQPAITCSKLTIKKLEQGVKYVQS